MVKKVIVFSGRKDSGKDTLAAYAGERLTTFEHTVRFAAFADAMKDLAIKVGFPVKSVLGTNMEKNEFIPQYGMSGREFMQKVGEALRKEIHKNIWSTGVCEQLGKSTAEYGIITDGRYAWDDEHGNEIKFVRDWCLSRKVPCFVVRILRAPHGESDKHSSERDLSNADANLFDCSIPPGFTIEQSLECVDGLLANMTQDIEEMCPQCGYWDEKSRKYHTEESTACFRCNYFDGGKTHARGLKFNYDLECID